MSESRQEERSTVATFCAVHPKQETGLRCNRCDRYMCHDCAVQTPVGYRCRECVKEQDRQFYDAHLSDDIRIALVCALYAAGGTIALAFFRFLLFALLLAFILGPIAGESARRAIGRRRSHRAPFAAAIGSFLGSLLVGYFLAGISLSWLLFAALFASLASGRLRWGR